MGNPLFLSKLFDGARAKPLKYHTLPFKGWEAVLVPFRRRRKSIGWRRPIKYFPVRVLSERIFSLNKLRPARIVLAHGHWSSNGPACGPQMAGIEREAADFMNEAWSAANRPERSLGRISATRAFGQ